MSARMELVSLRSEHEDARKQFQQALKEAADSYERARETAVTDEPAVMCARPLPCRPAMPPRIPDPTTERAVPTAAPLVRSGDDRWMVMMPPSLLLSIWSILTAFMWVCRHISWW